MQATKSSPQRRAADLAARDRVVMQEIEKEQKARDKKTARLRDLRLAKEAADKEATEKIEAEQLLAVEQTLKPPSSGKKPSRRRQKLPVETDGSKEQSAHG